MREFAVSAAKDDLSRLLRIAEKQDVVITRHGKPAGVLIGFRTEDDWFDYRLENDPRFLKRIAAARQRLLEGRGVRLEQLAEPNEHAQRTRKQAKRRRLSGSS